MQFYQSVLSIKIIVKRGNEMSFVFVALGGALGAVAIFISLINRQ